MVSRTSFLLICVLVGSAVAWQDDTSDQVNSFQEILERHFAHEIPTVLITKRSQDEMLGRRVRVCGRQLINMLQLVCRLNTRRKRSFEDEPESVLLMSLMSNYGIKSDLGDNPSSGGAHIVKRGASHDCCHSACTISHLMNYCPK